MTLDRPKQGKGIGSISEDFSEENYKECKGIRQGMTEASNTGKLVKQKGKSVYVFGSENAKTKENKSEIKTSNRQVEEVAKNEPGEEDYTDDFEV